MSVSAALARAKKSWFFGRNLTVRWHVAAPSQCSRRTTEGAVEDVENHPGTGLRFAEVGSVVGATRAVRGSGPGFPCSMQQPRSQFAGMRARVEMTREVRSTL